MLLLFFWTADVTAVTTHVGSERGKARVAIQLKPGWKQAENAQGTLISSGSQRTETGEEVGFGLGGGS